MRTRVTPYLVTAILAAATSCTVKSDRSECPCILDLQLSGGEETRADVLVWDETGSLAHSCNVPDPYVDELEIPKGRVTLAAMSGLHHCIREDTRIMVPVGLEMDELYCFCGKVDAQGESAGLQARLRKQYALLHVVVTGSDADSYPYYIRISGKVCGLDMTDMTPVPGTFSVMMHPIIGAYHRVCLPRQSDASLTLELLRKDGTSIVQNSDPTIPLGRFIAQSGFDWTQEDLEDIYIDVDYAEARVSVDIVPWKEESIL